MDSHSKSLHSCQLQCVGGWGWGGDSVKPVQPLDAPSRSPGCLGYEAMTCYVGDTLALFLSESWRAQSSRGLEGPLHKGFSLIIPHFNSSYPCTKPISIAHQTFLSPPCHNNSPCFVRGVAHSASSRLNVGVKCTHRLELALW